MKNVLVLSYYFPPAGGPGVQRVAKHVKYLRERGYNPIVITATPEDYTRHSGLAMPLDESLLRDIPRDIEVRRVRSHQPFRIFAWLKRLRLDYLREFFFVTDSAMTWIIPVIMEARRIAREKPIDLIYTSVKPHSLAITGWALKLLLRKSWILDFRDPWTQYFLATFPTRLHYEIERLLEKYLLRQADHVITITPTARENLLRWCSFLTPEKVSCITNGYDDTDFVGHGEEPAADGAFAIVYAGVFCGGAAIARSAGPNPVEALWRGIRSRLEYTPRRYDRAAHSPKFFLDALKELITERPDLRGRVRLIHAGPFSEENERYLKELGLEGIIDARGYLPHAEAVRCLEQGDAAFLCLADSPVGERNDCVPQKLYEYLGARKPVLALLPEGDAADFLRRAGTALICPPQDLRSIKKNLLALIEGRWQIQPDDRFIQSFQRRRLTGHLADIFDRTLGNPAAVPVSMEATASPTARERPEITVVIPARDRADDLRRCLAALAAQNFPASRFEVLVCDDGSREDLRKPVEQIKAMGLDVHHVWQPPKGPAAARNLGIRRAQGSIVAMTDSDTLPDRTWLSNLREALELNPEAIGVEGKVCADNDGQFGPLGEGPTNLAGGVYLTCNCAYRRDALLRAGGFDETFPYPAYEDTELAARLLELGSIVWQPEALVTHPQRRLTLRSVLKKLKHWEYVLIMGYRYGYLAWKQYPVRYPRLRVVLLSLFALPLSKLKTAASWFVRTPGPALTLALFGLIESLGALILVLPKVLMGDYSARIPRHKYLENIA